MSGKNVISLHLLKIFRQIIGEKKAKKWWIKQIFWKTSRTKDHLLCSKELLVEKEDPLHHTLPGQVLESSSSIGNLAREAWVFF